MIDRASLPVSTAVTRYPLLSRARVSERAVSGSSSTRRIVPAIIEPSCLAGKSNPPRYDSSHSRWSVRHPEVAYWFCFGCSYAERRQMDQYEFLTSQIRAKLAAIKDPPPGGVQRG